MLIDIFDEEKENPDDFISFIVFEPASLRIPDNDLLLIGDQVTDLFSKVIDSDNFESHIQDQILLNRLKRIEMMIELLKSNNGLILTKFLNKIWRRYSFFSNLGELFITQKDLKRFAPNYKFNESMILDRVIEAEETLEEDDNDSNDEDSNKENLSQDDKDAS
tara:strand:- start:110 stop:598 length:489 start_codon:yes stop_codon:yes gene_type:complete